MKHKDQTGANAIHQSAYVQSADPGAVGAFKDWYDTTTDPAIHKVRNTANDGWLTVGSAAADLASHLSDATDAHDASAISYAGGTGISATDVEAAVDELATEKANASDLTDHTGDTTDAHDASAISFTPAGTIAATDVQAAIEEVAAEATGGGGGSVIPVTIFSMTVPNAQYQWSNMPSALTEWGPGGTSWLQSRFWADLTNATQMRIIVGVTTTAGSTNAEIRAQYSTDSGSTWNYADNTSGPGVNISTLGIKKSSWISLHANAKADTLWRLVGINGDGVADPQFGTIQLQVQ